VIQVFHTVVPLAGVAAIWIAFCVIVGRAARSRGRSGAFWFVSSMALSPILTILALALLPDLEEARKNRKAFGALLPVEHRRCPNCGGSVNTRANYCKLCGVEFIALRSQLARV
jgi:hypothetical protein